MYMYLIVINCKHVRNYNTYPLYMYLYFYNTLHNNNYG